MKRDPRELEDVSVITLQHYNAHADEFREGTRAHDVSQNIAALLRESRGLEPRPLRRFP